MCIAYRRLRGTVYNYYYICSFIKCFLVFQYKKRASCTWLWISLILPSIWHAVAMRRKEEIPWRMGSCCDFCDCQIFCPAFKHMCFIWTELSLSERCECKMYTTLVCIQPAAPKAKCTLLDNIHTAVMSLCNFVFACKDAKINTLTFSLISIVIYLLIKLNFYEAHAVFFALFFCTNKKPLKHIQKKHHTIIHLL